MSWNEYTGPIDPDATGTDETDDWPSGYDDPEGPGCDYDHDNGGGFGGGYWHCEDPADVVTAEGCFCSLHAQELGYE